MTRRQKAFEAAFEAFKKEGKALGVTEFRNKYPQVAAELRRVQNEGDLRDALRRLPRIFSSRWHEVFEAKTGVVRTPEPEPVVKVSKKKTTPEVDPLEALKKARKKREEHE